MSTHFLEPTPPADWRKRAACLHNDPELFFPVGYATDADRWQAEEAKTVCRHCPVRRDCLNYAIDKGIKHGIYGGRTPDERDKVKRRRRRRRWPMRRGNA